MTDKRIIAEIKRHIADYEASYQRARNGFSRDAISDERATLLDFHSFILALPPDDLATELAVARAEVTRLRDALNHSLHAFRAQLSHGQRKGLAYGELTCLIALGSEPEHGRMGNCLTLGEETEHRKRIALSALDANGRGEP